MSDVKDILGFSSHSAQSLNTPSKQNKPKKIDGVKREVMMLMGGGKGSVSVVPTTSLAGLKEKRKVTQRASRWKWKAFNNGARTDGLILSHWEKDEGSLQQSETEKPYQFAKFNKRVKMTQYTPEEYDKCCQDPNWTKEETDYFFGLCQRFDLRFFVIFDRYDYENGPKRSVEDLKDRYYTIAKAVLTLRNTNSSSSVNLSELPVFKYPYDKEFDIERRKYVDKLFEQAKEEEEDESKKGKDQEDESVQKRNFRVAREQRLIEIGLEGQIKDVPYVLSLLTEPNFQGKVTKKKKLNSGESSATSLLFEGQQMISLPLKKPTLTTTRLRLMTETFEGTKAKKIETLSQELGIEKWLPKCPTEKVQDEFDALRVEMLLLTKLRNIRNGRNEQLQTLKSKMPTKE